MKCDPIENVIKKLEIKTNFGLYEIFENENVNFIVKPVSNIEIGNNNDETVNYYFVIFDEDWVKMIDYYFIYLKYIITKCGHNYIKVKYSELINLLLKTKNNIVILYKSIYSDENIFKINKLSTKIYFLNIEQLSVLDEIDDNCPHKKQIQEYLIKTYDFVNKNNIDLIDYSYENKDLWKKKFKINNVFILEPCLNSKLIIESPKNENLISLFNHISYRHEFKKNNLNDLNIKSFSGYIGNKRRKLFSESKILLNIHAGESYKICELFRIYEAIAHKNIIISQKCYNPNLVTLKKFIFFTDDKDFKNTTLKILHDYEKVYDTLYENKSIDEIFSIIEAEYISFFSNPIKHLV